MSELWPNLHSISKLYLYSCQSTSTANKPTKILLFQKVISYELKLYILAFKWHRFCLNLISTTQVMTQFVNTTQIPMIAALIQFCGPIRSTRYLNQLSTSLSKLYIFLSSFLQYKICNFQSLQLKICSKYKNSIHL